MTFSLQARPTCHPDRIRFPGLLFAGLLLWALTSARADDGHSERFDRARTAFDAGDWATAAHHYRTLEKQGNRHPSLLYNLGTVYAKAGDNARAAWYYRRAMRKAPRDSDSQANLTYVLNRAEAFTDTLSEPPVFRGLRRLSRREWSILFRIGYTLAVLSFGLGFWVRSGRRVLFGTACLGALLTALAGAGWGHWVWAERRPEAVIAHTRVFARSAPAEIHEKRFPVPRASLIRVLRIEPDWAHIQIGSRIGWIPADAMIPLDSPPEQWDIAVKDRAS